MVATVLRLKYTTVRHQLAREWWRALLLIGGAVWSLSLVPAVFWASRQLLEESPDVRADILVVVAAIVIAGWIAVPLMVTGLEDTLDPGRFATFGVSARQIAPGLTLAAFLTLPALFFTAALVVLALSWRDEGAATLAVGLAGALLTVAVMVLGARVAVAWAARAVNDRRTRGVLLIAVGLAVAVLGSVAWLALRDGLDSALEYEGQTLIEWLGRTPVGAGMAATEAASYGRWWPVAWRLGMMAATAVILAVAWRDSIAHALVHPVHRGGGRRRVADAVLASAADDGRGGAWWPAWLRADGPTRAVRSRLLVSWATDARYLVAASGVLALPVIFFAIAMPILDLDTRWAFVAPVILAASIGWGRHNDIAYDHTALWLDLVSGRLGRQIMMGRAQATLVWAAPACALAAIGILAWSGRWDAAPGLMGATLGTLGATLGVAAVASVLLPYRAPAPGENPFGAEVGSLGASLGSQLLSSAATLVVLPLVTVPMVLSLTVHAGWGWVSLVTGLVVGAGFLWGGVRLAGVLYDARSGRLLARIS
ncbi:hypothetical protein [Demequina sp. NBRC 110057]|uniref:hypothetical protein n=1 Tax=Demequina sp. NBRC 110057 TaxID=1570346 RepID=UPI001177DB7B|nr:hypothetical protein [Demequina sp. NBRC 110057]